MINKFTKKLFTDLLFNAGITVNGTKPWDIRTYNDDLYNRIAFNGVLGVGETYMDKLWDCEKLDEFFYHVFIANLDEKAPKGIKYQWLDFITKFVNFQTKSRSLQVAKKHYDLGNLLFQCMLDKRMNYTCGYWKSATNLEDAQLAKLELTCQKLQLEPGMRLLDVGCGWGALAKHAAENYGVEVVGITISENQIELAKQNCAGLPIEIRLQDYRDINERFDRIVSLGMFEHVGPLNYKTYMGIMHQCLNDNGLFLLHTIGTNRPYGKQNEWIQKYIFPNGQIPFLAQTVKAFDAFFIMEDWHNFGADYDKTLMAWQKNFDSHWVSTLKTHYDERFYRMWNFYLLSCAANFRARVLQLWQIVLSKKGVKNGYRGVR